MTGTFSNLMGVVVYRHVIVFRRHFVLTLVFYLNMMSLSTLLQFYKYCVTGALITSLCWASFVGSQRDATRICCWAPAPAARHLQCACSYWSISAECPQGTQQQTRRPTSRLLIDGTDGWTVTYYVGSVNNIYSLLLFINCYYLELNTAKCFSFVDWCLTGSFWNWLQTMSPVHHGLYCIKILCANSKHSTKLAFTFITGHHLK